MLPLHLGFHIVVNLIRLRYDGCNHQNNECEKGSTFPVHGLFYHFQIVIGVAAAVLVPAFPAAERRVFDYYEARDSGCHTPVQQSTYLPALMTQGFAW